MTVILPALALAAVLACPLLRPGAAAASPNTLVCGESTLISIRVEDAAGQPVSDHTPMEFTTNLGGVLAGSPFAPRPSGPLTSATAETFDGIASVYLLTSATHTGPYEVVASVRRTPFSRLSSGPPLAALVAVHCLPAVDR